MTQIRSIEFGTKFLLDELEIEKGYISSPVLEDSSVLHIFESPRKIRALVALRDQIEYWVDPSVVNPIAKFDVSAIARFLGAELLHLQQVFAMVLPGWKKRQREFFPDSAYFLDGDIGVRLYNPEWDDEAEVRGHLENLNGAIYIHETRMVGSADLTLPEPGIYTEGSGGPDHLYDFEDVLVEPRHPHEAWLYMPNAKGYSDGIA